MQREAVAAGRRRLGRIRRSSVVRKARRMLHDYRKARRTETTREALAGAARTLGSYGSAWRFDRRYGVETSTWVTLVDVTTVGASQDHGSPYEPTRLDDFRQLRRLELPREGTFVDLGSGKGLALMLAVLDGFTKVKGVEFSPELCATSRRNLDRFRSSSGRVFISTIVCQDAASFQPDDDDIVFFMFNPFDDKVLAAVLGSIHASLRRRPRRAHLLYHGALHAQVIEDSGRWSLAGQEGSVLHFVSG